MHRRRAVSNLTAVTTGNLNLRQMGAKDAPILTLIPSGTPIEVLGNAGSWLYVRFGDKSGFAYSEFTNPQSADAPGAWKTTVTADSLNVRAGPSTGANRIGSLAHGQQVDVSGYTGTWLRIQHGGGAGFISADYTQSVSPQTGEAVGPAQVQAFAESIKPAGVPVGEPDPQPAPAADIGIKARLTPEEIRQIRDSIKQETDQRVRGDRYEALQGRVFYASQRDNQVRAPGGSKVETKSGNMCNLTSLSMALSYLGISNPRPGMQYEDALEQLRVERHLPDRTSSNGWGGVARALGAQVVMIGSSVTQGHDWWDANVRQPYLRKGAGAIMSIGGHIVRVQAVTDPGLVVDDPYGHCRLLPGEERAWKYDRVNAYEVTGQTAGEDSLWLWADVSRHTMRWIAALKPAPVVLGDEEPIPHFDDDGVVMENINV